MRCAKLQDVLISSGNLVSLIQNTCVCAIACGILVSDV